MSLLQLTSILFLTSPQHPYYTSYTMFRAAIPAFRAVARSSVIAARPVAQTQRIAGQRWYAASAGLDKEQITSRVLEVLKGFEKVDGGKVS